MLIIYISIFVKMGNSCSSDTDESIKIYYSVSAYIDSQHMDLLSVFSNKINDIAYESRKNDGDIEIASFVEMYFANKQSLIREFVIWQISMLSKEDIFARYLFFENFHENFHEFLNSMDIDKKCAEPFFETLNDLMSDFKSWHNKKFLLHHEQDSYKPASSRDEVLDEIEHICHEKQNYAFTCDEDVIMNMDEDEHSSSSCIIESPQKEIIGQMHEGYDETLPYTEINYDAPIYYDKKTNKRNTEYESNPIEKKRLKDQIIINKL